MARRRVDQWGMTFGISRHAAGYEWRGENEFSQTLVPAGLTHQPGKFRTEISGAPIAVKHERGIGVTKSAYRAFVKLSKALEATEAIAEQKALIIEFANQYGQLQGSQSCREWVKEAKRFLDLHEISEAIRTPRLGDFEKRVRSRSNGHTRLVYSTWRSGEWTIATDAEWIEARRSSNALPNLVSAYEIAVNSNPREQAILLLTRAVNERMAGGLSFNASVQDSDRFVVGPKSLAHMLYLRLWMDTVDNEELERQSTCRNPGCGRPIQQPKTGRPRQYCSEECRWERNNRKKPRSE